VALAAAAILPLVVATSGFAQAPQDRARGVDETVVVENLKGIVVVASDQDVKLGGVTGVKGVEVKGPEFLRRAGFKKLLKRHIGSRLDKPKLIQLQVEIRKYCQAHNHLVVDVFTSQQEILEDTIQIAVVEGKLDKVEVGTNRFHKWFPDSVIKRNVRLKPGDVVRESRLNSDLKWLNQNTYQNLGYDEFSGSFLDVSANFHQGEGLGQTDLSLVEGRNRFPMRGFVGIDNGGIEIVGQERLFAGADAANPYWIGNRLSYQYITDVDFNKFSQHVGSVVIPVVGRTELTLFGTYADLNPDFSIINSSYTNLEQKGFFYQLSARYTVPLPGSRSYSHDLTAGFDFKRTDTPLLFASSGSEGLIRTNQVDIAQFSLGYSGRLRDRWGDTAFSLQGFYSPGGLSEYNDSAAFNEFEPGSNPQYLYGRAEIRRLTRLPVGFAWYARAAGQLADARLVATEAFSLGGWDSVRGYDQNVVSGDNGWVLVNELRTPPLPLFGNFIGKSKAQAEGPFDGIRGLVFIDWGRTVYRSPAREGWPSSETLLSVGVGLRYQLKQNFMVRFDYGWQLDRDYVNADAAASLGPQPSQRAHFGLELSF
jgi:hemolysin activation/secretion protein